MTQTFVVTFRSKENKDLYAIIKGDRVKICTRVLSFLKEVRQYGAEVSANIVLAENFKHRLKK